MRYYLLIFLFCLPWQIASSQKFYFRGEVKDDAGNPLQNVSILQHRTGYVFRSGTSGSFGVTSNFNPDTLSFILDGYKTEKRLYNANEYLRITLKLLPPVIGNPQREKLASITNDLNLSDKKKLAIGDETYTEIVENHFVNASKFPSTGLSLNVNKASYSNIRRFINQSSLVPADAVRIEEMLNYFNLDYKQPDTNQLFSASTKLSDCPWDKTHKLFHVNLSSQKLNLDSLPPSHLVFLIDVSASMDMPNRLPLLQSAFRLLINNLRPKDSVSIVVYGGITAVMVNSLSGEHKDSLYKVIDGLTPGGSTPGESGIKLAYQIASRHFIKGGNNRVILATDGDFNVGLKSEADLDEMISSQRQSGVYLTCLGVGMGNYKDSKIQLLAEKGNGNFAYLDNFQEAEKVLMTEFTQTLFSVADDVYMDIKFNPALISSFRLLGFDNKAGALQDSLSVIEGGEIGSGYSLEAVFEVELTIFGSAILAHTNSTICSDTLADIKLQYRYPGDSTHLHFLHNALFTAESDSISIRKSNFTAAVIYLGMMLKQSVYVNSKKFGWDELLQLASANANMTDPYQREFVSMVQRAKELFGHKKKKGLKGLFN